MTPCSSFRAVMFVIRKNQRITGLAFIDRHIVEIIPPDPPPQFITSFIVLPVDVYSRHVRDCVWLIASFSCRTLNGYELIFSIELILTGAWLNW